MWWSGNKENFQEQFANLEILKCPTMLDLYLFIYIGNFYWGQWDEIDLDKQFRKK